MEKSLARRRHLATLALLVTVVAARYAATLLRFGVMLGGGG